MATANKTKGQKEELITALYCRLSVDDDNKDMESNSITNQKQILQDFARREGYRNTQFFVDDGVSGTTFQREGFQQMQKMVEDGLIGTIIVKDLSRFGREQVEMGRLTQIVYPSLGVTFISIQENAVDVAAVHIALAGDGAAASPSTARDPSPPANTGPSKCPLRASSTGNRSTCLCRPASRPSTP